MPEFRRDIIRREWVALATGRAKRPADFVKDRKDPQMNPKSDNSGCFFCPGHESETPPEVLAYSKDENRKSDTSGWWVRAFPNKFPAFVPGEEFAQEHYQIYQHGEAVGFHEVIATADHNIPPALFSTEQMEMMLRAYEERFQVHCAKDVVKYILIIYNHGKSAGASLEHPHSQLFAIPIVSNYLKVELRGAEKYHHTHKKCVFCSIIDNEVSKAKGQRVVYDSEKFIALAPYASRNPFETWILPKDHNPFFQIEDYATRVQLAECLRTVLKKLYVGLKNPDFNYYIQTAPCDGKDYGYYHWHLEILPRLSVRAGFEYGTGIIINTVSPEDAAKYLREVNID